MAKKKGIASVTAYYKGFDREFKCRGFQFEVGKTYEESKASLCSSGFHACENPVDVLSYYPPCTSRYAIVELEGVSEQREKDSKVCATKITIVRELSIKEYVAECAKWFSSQKFEGQSSGNYGHAQSSGYYSVAVSLGRFGTAMADGKSKFIVLADWRNGELVDVKVGRVGDNIESGKKYSLVDGEFVAKEPQ